MHSEIVYIPVSCRQIKRRADDNIKETAATTYNDRTTITNDSQHETTFGITTLYVFDGLAYLLSSFTEQVNEGCTKTCLQVQLRLLHSDRCASVALKALADQRAAHVESTPKSAAYSRLVVANSAAFLKAPNTSESSSAGS
eukprot:4418501-Pleurochrysis_carterae.AAC.8